MEKMYEEWWEEWEGEISQIQATGERGTLRENQQIERMEK